MKVATAGQCVNSASNAIAGSSSSHACTALRRWVIALAPYELRTGYGRPWLAETGGVRRLVGSSPACGGGAERSEAEGAWPPHRPWGLPPPAFGHLPRKRGRIQS